MLAPLVSVGKKKGYGRFRTLLCLAELPNLSANKFVNGLSRKPCQAASPHVNCGGSRHSLTPCSTLIGDENCQRIEFCPLHTFVGFTFHQPRLEIGTGGCE